MEEMKRIKKYMEKISDAERASQSKCLNTQPRFSLPLQDPVFLSDAHLRIFPTDLTHSKLDTQVANRFIKSAIASATAPSQPAAGSTSKTAIGVIGNHLRFDVKGEALTERAAAKIAARLDVDEEEEDNSSDEVLEVLGGALGNRSEPTAKASVSSKGKDKETPNIEVGFRVLIHFTV
jgi:hypothetical protein